MQGDPHCMIVKTTSLRFQICLSIFEHYKLEGKSSTSEYTRDILGFTFKRQNTFWAPDSSHSIMRLAQSIGAELKMGARHKKNFRGRQAFSENYSIQMECNEFYVIHMQSKKETPFKRNNFKIISWRQKRSVKVALQFRLWDPSVPPSMKQTAVAQATGSNKSQEESSRIGKASLMLTNAMDGTFSICNIPPKIMKGFDQKISLENLIAWSLPAR